MSAPTLSTTTPPADRQSEKRNTLWFWVGVLGVAILIFVLLPIVAIYGWRAAAEARVEAKLAAIRARGEPTTMEELDAYHRAAAESSEAAHAWEAAFALDKNVVAKLRDLPVPIIGVGVTPLPAPGEPWPEREELAAFFRLHADYLAAIEAAVAKGGKSCMPIEFKGFDTELKHVNAIRNCQYMLEGDALLRIHDGDGAVAFQRIEQMLATAPVIEDEPTLVSFLVYSTLRLMTFQIAAEAASAEILSDDELQKLQRSLRAIEIDGPLLRALRGERAMAIYEQHRAVAGQFNATDLGEYQHARWLCQYSDLEKMLAFQESLLAVAATTWPTRVAALNADDKRFRDWAKSLTAVEKARYTMTLLLMPATSAVVLVAQRVIAARDLTDVVLALARYRRQHTQLPLELDELVPDYLPTAPIDIYDGRRLRYRLDPDAAVVWCIGRNLVDDGGEQKPGVQGEPDLVVRLRLQTGDAKSGSEAAP